MKLIKQHLLATKAAVEDIMYKSTDTAHDRVVVFGGTGAIKLPAGTSAEQPSNPIDLQHAIDMQYKAQASVQKEENTITKLKRIL